MATAVFGIAEGVRRRANRGAYAGEGLLRVYAERRATMSEGGHGQLEAGEIILGRQTNLRDQSRRHLDMCSPGRIYWLRVSSLVLTDLAV